MFSVKVTRTMHQPLLQNLQWKRIIWRDGRSENTLPSYNYIYIYILSVYYNILYTLRTHNIDMFYNNIYYYMKTCIANCVYAYNIIIYTRMRATLEIYIIYLPLSSRFILFYSVECAALGLFYPTLDIHV